MKLPIVSVIIVNWNGGLVFENCLNSLSKMTFEDWELIVVDNASNDASQHLSTKILKNINIKLIQNKHNLGFAPANNQGLKLARGKYVLLLNNDMKVKPDLLNTLVKKMESGSKIGVIQPKIKMMDKPGYLDNAGSFFTRIGFLKHWGFGQKDSSEFNSETKVFSAKGACMFIRKSLVDEIELFDPAFVSYFEESDFCWRVWLAGFQVLFYPKTYIYHKVGFTIKRMDVGNINFHYYKNRLASLIKNLELINLLLVLPVHLILSLGIVLAFLLRGNPRASKMIINAIVWNCLNLGTTLRKRKTVQKMRKLRDHQFLDYLTKPIDFKGFFNDFKRVEKDLVN